MNDPPIRIVVSDDNALLRDVLNAEDGLLVVAEAVTGEEIIAAVEQTAVDVVITDLRKPGMDRIDCRSAADRGTR
jgi:CheY-like chemotaxis protein